MFSLSALADLSESEVKSYIISNYQLGNLGAIIGAVFVVVFASASTIETVHLVCLLILFFLLLQSVVLTLKDCWNPTSSYASVYRRGKALHIAFCLSFFHQAFISSIFSFLQQAYISLFLYTVYTIAAIIFMVCLCWLCGLFCGWCINVLCFTKQKQIPLPSFAVRNSWFYDIPSLFSVENFKSRPAMLAFLYTMCYQIPYKSTQTVEALLSNFVAVEVGWVSDFVVMSTYTCLPFYKYVRINSKCLCSQSEDL